MMGKSSIRTPLFLPSIFATGGVIPRFNITMKQVYYCVLYLLWHIECIFRITYACQFVVLAFNGREGYRWSSYRYGYITSLLNLLKVWVRWKQYITHEDINLHNYSINFSLQVYVVWNIIIIIETVIITMFFKYYEHFSWSRKTQTIKDLWIDITHI